MPSCPPVVWPPSLRPGDEVAVVAPSGPMPRDEFFAGLAWLRQRYRVHVRPDVLARHGYLAGDDARRLAELRSALAMSGVRAIIAARGGYGATRIIEGVASEELFARPRWICGFSDITTLHIEAAAFGVASLHSANVTGLARAHAQDRCDFLRALEGDPRARHWTGLTRLATAENQSATAQGSLFGGNLSLLFTQAAAGRLKPPEGAIWLLEDIGERPYRVDRMLTALQAHMARAQAIVFGDFTNCETPADAGTVRDVIAEFATRARVPVVYGAPFGHGTPNSPWIQGATAELRGTGLTLFGRATAF